MWIHVTVVSARKLHFSASAIPLALGSFSYMRTQPGVRNWTGSALFIRPARFRAQWQSFLEWHFNCGMKNKRFAVEPLSPARQQRVHRRTYRHSHSGSFNLVDVIFNEIWVCMDATTRWRGSRRKNGRNISINASQNEMHHLIFSIAEIGFRARTVLCRLTFAGEDLILWCEIRT